VTLVTIREHAGATHSRLIASWRFDAVLQHLASLESIFRSFIATAALLLVAMLIAGGLGISGPAILTFSIWISLIGLVAVGAFLIARARRPYAGAGALVAAIAGLDGVLLAVEPGPVPVACRSPGSNRPRRGRHGRLGHDCRVPGSQHHKGVVAAANRAGEGHTMI
jgi:hypothetical protein